MRLLFLVLGMGLAGQAFALDRFCEVDKSLIRFDESTNQVKIRRALSEKFFITTEEHEEPKLLSLVDGDGADWGTVQVSTGSYQVQGEQGFYANAKILRDAGMISAWLTLRMLDLPGDSSASSMILTGEEAEAAPTLTLHCVAKN